MVEITFVGGLRDTPQEVHGRPILSKNRGAAYLEQDNELMETVKDKNVAQ